MLDVIFVVNDRPVPRDVVCLFINPVLAVRRLRGRGKGQRERGVGQFEYEGPHVWHMYTRTSKRGDSSDDAGAGEVIPNITQEVL